MNKNQNVDLDGAIKYDDKHQIKHEKTFNMFVRRLCAAVVDVLIVLLMLWFSNAILYNLNLSSTESEKIFVILNYVLVWLYFAVAESSKYNATLGKRLLGIQVVLSNGDRISLMHGVERHFIRQFSVGFLFYGYLYSLIDSKGRTLHDHVTKTNVISRKSDPFSAEKIEENNSRSDGYSDV